MSTKFRATLASPMTGGEVDINFQKIPALLKIPGPDRKSPHILNPEKIAFFDSLLDDVYAECVRIRGEFFYEEGANYTRIFAQIFLFLGPFFERLYKEHGTELERMIMHVSHSMIRNSKKFLPFFMMQLFLHQKSLKRNLPISQSIIDAKAMEEIDMDVIQSNLRRDVSGTLFIRSDFPCAFTTTETRPVGIQSSIRIKTITWSTDGMAEDLVPELRKLMALQPQVDDKIDSWTPGGEKHQAVPFYQLFEMKEDDMPETIVYMGDHLIFDTGVKNQKLIATINRYPGEREMRAFRQLLASCNLACYQSILTRLVTPPFLYLWKQLLREAPELLKKIQRYPGCEERKFFESIFDENSIKSLLSVETGLLLSGEEIAKVSKAVVAKLGAPTPIPEEPFGPDMDELERQRDTCNRRITAILNGHIVVRNKSKEIERLTQEVARLNRIVISPWWRERAKTETDLLSADESHQQKRIEIEVGLIGLEVHREIPPTYIDLTLLQELGYPNDVLVAVSQKLPGEREFSDIQGDMALPADGQIALPSVTLTNNGEIQYRLDFTAPEGKEFAPGISTKSIVLKTNRLSKPAEKEKKRPKEDEPSAEVVEAESLKAALLILQTYQDVYERTGTYVDGIVTLELDEKHIGDKRKIQPHHKKWTISDTGEIFPVFDGPEKAMILALAEKIRARVRREKAEKTERDKEAQSLSAAIIVLSEYRDVYEQEGEHSDGIVTIRLEDEHIQSVLSIVGEEGSEVRDYHRVWRITDAGEISPAFKGEETDMILTLAEKIRARVKQEKVEEVENERLKFIEAIDAEFQALGFTLSDALDTTDLRRELERKITAFKAKYQDTSATWEKEIARLSAVCKQNGYLFYRANCENGFPTSITFGKKDAWRAVLTLQPSLNFKLFNPPQENGEIFRQRMENVMMTFAYDIMKNGDHSIKALAQETCAKGNLTILRKDYKRDLNSRKAKIIAQDKNGHFQIIRNISRANLEAELTSAQAQYGQGNVALLLREATYRFQGEQGCIRFDVGKILATYGDFDDADICLERKKILRERIVRTLCKKHVQGATKRGEFIVGSGVDQVLSEVQSDFVARKNGEPLIESDIDDAFLNAFITKLKAGNNPVPILYVDHRVAYCRAEDVGELIAD